MRSCVISFSFVGVFLLLSCDSPAAGTLGGSCEANPACPDLGKCACDLGLECVDGTCRKIPLDEYPDTDTADLYSSIPKPIIAVRFNNPISGYKDFRIIKDPVNMDISLSCPGKPGADMALCNRFISDTVVSDETITAADFKAKCCLPDWKDTYCLSYSWSLTETPTPYAYETRIVLDNIPDSGEGSWYRACGSLDPTLASFKGYALSPNAGGKSYKVQIMASTFNKNLDMDGEIAIREVVPNIIPNVRVMVQLTYDEGLQTRAQLDRQEGVMVDIDLHLIKKKGMDACGVEVGTDGLLCTSMGTPLFPDGASPTHDDCHFNDVGNNGEWVWDGCDGDFKTIAWYAALDLDNRWGGGGYTNPEIIDLGPIVDADPSDGQPDLPPYSDEYLVVVNYNRCQNLIEGGSDADCVEGGADYNVHGRVDVFVDGVAAPRAGKDAAALKSDFVIRPGEWIVLQRIRWDNTLSGKWAGDAVVESAFEDYAVCQFELAYCHNFPIWDRTAYETRVTGDPYLEPYEGAGGSCYDYGTRE